MISLRITVLDRMTPAIDGLWWRLWWLDWGTNGHRRRTALVVRAGAR